MQINSIQAELILENGVRFKGRAYGHIHDITGELIFTTRSTGYQEIITDPALYGSIVVMTSPSIGNYGINLDDNESAAPTIKAMVMREICNFPNNWRMEMELAGYMKQNKILALTGIDTRALTKILRNEGSMKGIITIRGAMLTESQISVNFNSFNNNNAVKKLSCQSKYNINGSNKKAAVLDMGINNSLINGLKDRSYTITVFPYNTEAEQILAENPDMLIISNGPGSPANLPGVSDELKKLIGKLPIRGIGLGHLLVSQSLGCETEKMKFGHNGSNHAVKELQTNKIQITTQNHQYVVTKIPNNIETTHINVNDGTIEGIQCPQTNTKTIQYNEDYNRAKTTIIDRIY